MRSLGVFILFIRDAFAEIQSYRGLLDSIFKESIKVGFNSLTVVMIISVLVGGISAIQTTYALSSPLIQDFVIGLVVRDTVFSLNPTLIALVFAGKVGSGIASELGTMQVSEQVDALEIMGINPGSFLVLPKILASLIMSPVLIVISIFVSIFSGYVFVDFLELISGTEYLIGIRSDFQPGVINMIMTKAVVYGILVSSIASFQGLNTRGGALEVGNSNTRSIVISSIAILASDYVLTNLFSLT